MQEKYNNMKKLILLFVIIAAFTSCKKCADCTRTWSYESYELTADGQHINVNTVPISSVETFDICGGDDISNAEKTVVNTTTNIVDGHTYIGVNTGTCNCVVQ